MLGHQLHRALAGGRLERAVAGRLENVTKQLHVPLVVLHHQDLQARHRSTGLRGSVNTNVLRPREPRYRTRYGRDASRRSASTARARGQSLRAASHRPRSA